MTEIEALKLSLGIVRYNFEVGVNYIKSQNKL